MISREDILEFGKTIKVGLVATIDDEGEPHISILSTLMAKSEDKMMLGEFITGISKQSLMKRNQAGFLIMSLDRHFWTGKMKWTHKLSEGEDYIQYNMQPKYRYNSYFGIHTVHYFDLISIEGKVKLNMAAIIKSALKVLILKGKLRGGNNIKMLKPWAFKLMSKLDTLKFISFIDDDGYPKILPIIEAQAVSENRIVLTDKPYSDELTKLSAGTKVAIFGLNLNMENVLIKGVFNGYNKNLATVDIERVYNSMPPKHGYIYPEEEIKAVKEF